MWQDKSVTSQTQQARVHGWNKQTWYQGKEQSSTTEQDSYMETHKLERKHTPGLEAGRTRDRETERKGKERNGKKAFLT